MSAFAIVVPERAPPAVNVAVAKAADVVTRATRGRGEEWRDANANANANANARDGATAKEEDDGNDEVPFKRKRGAFAKDCTCARTRMSAMTTMTNDATGREGEKVFERATDDVANRARAQWHT